MAGVRLILSSEPVSRLGAQPARRPSVAVVYAGYDGELHLIDGGKPASWWEQAKSHYRSRYEVDTSDHQRGVELRNSPPLAEDGVYAFNASLTVNFRVFDPVEIVRRNIQDALTPVYGHLVHVCRNITARYSIENAISAENAINDRFRHPERLAEGIEIFMVRARLTPDADSLRYLQAQVEASRDGIVHAVQHAVAYEDVARENDILLRRQAGELEARGRERKDMQGRPIDVEEMIRVHLERHPGDTAGAMDLVREAIKARNERQDRLDDNNRELIELMVSRGLLRPVDVAHIRDQMLHSLSAAQTQTAPQPPIQATAEWDAPLREHGEPARSVTAATSSTTVLPGLIPVYLVFDESLEANIPDLDTAIQDMYDALVESPEIASVVRLSVLGFAGDAEIKRALELVDRMTPPPHLSPGGPPRYGAAFERLLHCIPKDALTLKAQNGAVRRPQVIFLTGGQPVDEATWQALHGRLVDRTQHPTAPDIVAVGVGGAASATVAGIATRPDYAFVATTSDVAQAIRQFSAFVNAHVLSYGRAVIDGDQMPYFQAPEGFRRAVDVR